MSTLNYINVIERYHEYREAIHNLLASILSGIAVEPVFHDKDKQCKAMKSLGDKYPFINLLYVLDENGIQIGDNIAVSSSDPNAYTGKGIDRSQRPYFQLAQHGDEICITEPYLSTVTRRLCLSATIKRKIDGATEYLVLDSDLSAIVEFLLGDSIRRKFQPLFKVVYSLISLGLFCVVIFLLFIAFRDVMHLGFGEDDIDSKQLKPFSIIIFLTLGLAIFDLAKTTLEEEVLMHKDIFRHSSTRRTITRFIAAIVIAVSIESLLLMFKSVIGDEEQLIKSVWMMFAAVSLLTGLGIYVFLGAKAESILIEQRRQ